jgi:hypothetical protein
MTQSDHKVAASPTKPVSRRGIVHGAMWTVPVIAASVAAPAVAASPIECPTGAISMLNGVAQGTYDSVPTDAQALGGNYFLRPNGDLYYGNTIALTGVASAAAAMRAGQAGHFANAILSSGGSVTLQGAQTYSTLPSTGAGATPLSANYYLAGTSLWYNEELMATDVASAVAGATGEGDRATVVLSTGGSLVFLDGVQESADPTTGAQATALGSNYFLTAGGYLYYGQTLVVSGVASAQVQHTGAAAGPEAAADVVLVGGTAQEYRGTTLEATRTGVPAGAIALGASYYLLGDDLYYQDAIVQTGVASAITQGGDQTQEWVNFVLSGIC